MSNELGLDMELFDCDLLDYNLYYSLLLKYYTLYLNTILLLNSSLSYSAFISWTRIVSQLGKSIRSR